MPTSRPSRFALLTRAALPAAPLALAAVPSSHAQIIHTDPVDLTVSAGSKLYLDFGVGGSQGSVGASALPSYDFFVEFQSNDANFPKFQDLGSTQIARTPAYRAANLSFGSTINGSIPLSGNYSYINTSNGSNNAHWAAGTTGYLGFRFNTTTSPLFGWVQFSYNADKSITVYDFAYEASGGAILAGAGAIPEPSTYAALAGLLAGSAALYRRRQQQKAVA